MTVVLEKNPALTWEISYKDTITAAWSAINVDIFPLLITFTLAPLRPEARIMLKRGSQLRVTGSSTGPVLTEALDLTGKFIRIKIINPAAEDKLWTGYVAGTIDDIKGSYIDPLSVDPNIVNVDTTYQCFGLEYFLDNLISQVEATADRTINSVLPFNHTSGARNKKIIGNKETTKQNGSYFQFDNDADYWTALDVLEHLLGQFAIETGMTIVLDRTGADFPQYLANSVQIWNFAGATYRQAINTLINPNLHGMTWSLDCTDGVGGTTTITMHVYSIVDYAIDDGATPTPTVLLAANPISKTILAATDETIKSCQVQDLETNHYDEIVVEGGLVRTTFSMAFDVAVNPDAVLEKGWEPGEETAYKALTDKQRRLEKYNHIFCKYKLKADWNGKSNGKIVLSPVDTTTGKLIDDNIEISEGLYSSYQIQRNLPIELNGEPLAMLAYAKDTAGLYNALDEPIDPEGKTATSGVGPLESEVGIRAIPAKSSAPHFMALNSFDEVTDDSDIEPIYDYNDLVCTVAMYTNERIRVVTSSDVEPGQFTRRKTIKVEGVELWFVPAETVIGIDNDGVLIKSSISKYERDNTGLLRNISRLATAFYGKKRSKIKVIYNYPTINELDIGDLVAELDEGPTVTSVGTIISELKYNFDETIQTMSVSTTFYELNFTNHFRRG